MASSMSGQWLKADGYLEFIDPTTGETLTLTTDPTLTPNPDH